MPGDQSQHRDVDMMQGPWSKQGKRWVRFGPGGCEASPAACGAGREGLNNEQTQKGQPGGKRGMGSRMGAGDLLREGGLTGAFGFFFFEGL